MAQTTIEIGAFQAGKFVLKHDCEFGGLGETLDFRQPGNPHLAHSFPLENKFVEMEVRFNTSNSKFEAVVEDNASNPGTFDKYFHILAGMDAACHFEERPNNKVAFIGNGDVRDFASNQPTSDIEEVSNVTLTFSMVVVSGAGGFNKLKVKVN